MDWIVKSFHGWIITKLASKEPFHQINSIIIPSMEYLKNFVAKISRIEQNL